MHDGTPAAAHRPRSTLRVLTLLVLFGGGALLLLGLCVSAYVRGTPDRTLTVRLDQLEVDTPRFYPLPSFGADAAGRTHGVWVVLQTDGTATALLARDPYDGCTIPWRAEVTFEGRVGVFKSPCHGAMYDRDGAYIGGVAQAPRGLDRYSARVGDTHVRVSLERIELGPCAAATSDARDCSRRGAPVRRVEPPEPTSMGR